MADICIIYAREDHAIAEKLHGLLSQQWDTWWDEKIVGEFSKEIEAEIPKAGCIVPIFSANSREKGTVTDELRLGQKHNKKLLPIRLDDSDAPYSFGSYSTIDMRSWSGEVDHPGFKLLQRKISSVVPPRVQPQRPVAIANDKLLLPTLFLSVSSYDTQLKPPDAAVRALRVFGASSILVSAYDLVPSRKPQAMIEELMEYRKNGGFVLVDSGNYEASRLDDKSWSPNDLKEALAQTPHDWVFCFDEMKPSLDRNRAVKEIVEAVKRDQVFTSAPVLPIVHTPTLEQGGYELENIPWVVREVAEILNPQLIAIPERELGPGLIARAKTVQNIRKELSKLPFYQPIHLLGTGNPWSIPIFAAAGADTFDGLEWCRMAVDRATNRLHHFQHFDFFTYQTCVADSPITRNALEDSKIDFAGKVAFHNLDYYASFVKELRGYVNKDNLEAFVIGLTGNDTAKQLKQQVPGLFQGHVKVLFNSPLFQMK